MKSLRNVSDLETLLLEISSRKQRLQTASHRHRETTKMLPNQGRGTKSRHLLQGMVTHPLLMWQVAAKPQKRQAGPRGAGREAFSLRLVE